MRIGLSCADAPPPAELLDLLGEATLPVAPLRDARPPAILPAEGALWLLAPAGDVLSACDRGAIDIGVVGKDRLLEGICGVSELLDLGIARDELVYATPTAGQCRRARPRVATRYLEAARGFFAAGGRQVELIEMATPVLAPALGLADGIVELASRLPAAPPDADPAFDVREVVAECSARLVAGRAARALVGASLGELVERLRILVEDR